MTTQSPITGKRREAGMGERKHVLKADPIPFGDVASGKKLCEVRVNDRGYQVGDILHLREFCRETQTYSGCAVRKLVTHIQTGYGLPDGIVVMSIANLGAAQGEV